ncbi:hypothetical protein ACTWPT_32740 [Nonomuraea sp. 3N208]|uniref:hypothetical protein n=1 Tax=Nonomuraea sp. 3N208 TaxID=3457421 RepID=UPI003FCF5599
MIRTTSRWPSTTPTHLTCTRAWQSVNDETLDQTQAAELRDKFADEPIATGHIRSAPVEAAFRTVPRHAFVPADTPLEITYQAGDQSAGAAGDVPGQCAANRVRLIAP